MHNERPVLSAAAVLVFATGILPSIGFAPVPSGPGASSPLLRQGGFLPGWSGTTDEVPRMRVACAARMTLSQQPRRQEGNDDTQVWPTLDQSCPPVHVRIMVGAQSKENVGALGTLVPPVGKKMVPDYSVAVNDRIRKPLASGYSP